eukprot:m.108580 g.108580  ORF g.108580 m.108580 type:complete len:208 (-) comp13350_c2_seq6:3160-3783(-)
MCAKAIHLRAPFISLFIFQLLTRCTVCGVAPNRLLVLRPTQPKMDPLASALSQAQKEVTDQAQHVRGVLGECNAAVSAARQHNNAGLQQVDTVGQELAAAMQEIQGLLQRRQAQTQTLKDTQARLQFQQEMDAGAAGRTANDLKRTAQILECTTKSSSLLQKWHGQIDQVLQGMQQIQAGLTTLDTLEAVAQKGLNAAYTAYLAEVF